MLTSGLRRAQLDLQCHRLWLRAFGCSHASSSKIIREPLPSEKRPRSSRSTKSRGIESFEELLEMATQNAAPAVKRSPAQQRKWERKTNRTIGQRLRDGPKRRMVSLNALGDREDLLVAIKKQDAQEIAQVYSSLPERKPLASEDFHAIAQCIHTCLRLEYQTPEAKRDRQAIAEIMNFAELLVQDITRGNLVPNVAAHMHLLGLFKETRSFGAGERFWKWLQTQDDWHVGPEVYSVAIEIFALAGRPLQDCEKLYKECLARFPGTFFAYHLSPTAVLPDREKPFELKGIPMMLVNAIIQARLLGGDTQGAYLALDTSLRMYPTTISRRILRAFLLQRPITEAYAIYAMTYRAGMDTSGMVFKKLFSTLRLASNMSSVSVHFQVLRAMVSIMYLYVGTAKMIGSNTLNELTIAITHIGLLPGVANMTQLQRDEIFGEVLDVIKTTWEIASRYQAFPTITAFNNLIGNVGVAAKSRAVVDVATANMQTMSLEPTDVTRRAIMNVAGATGDVDLIQETWSEIVRARQSKGKHPDLVDVNLTIKAARRAGMTAFVQQTAEHARLSLPANDRKAVDYYLTRPEEQTLQGESSTAQEILEGVRKLRADLAVFDEKTKIPGQQLDFSKRPGTLLRDPSIFSSIPEMDMRKIYDEFTTEQVVAPKPSSVDGFAEHETSSFSPAATTKSTITVQSKPPASIPVHFSTTGLSLSTLRYESWRTIKSLLHHSAANDRVHTEAVDVAIWKGQSPPARNMGFAEDELEIGKYGFGNVGLSEWLGDSRRDEQDMKAGDAAEAGSEEELAAKVDLVRREISKLRRRE